MTQVPAGGALAVDREGFSDFVTREVSNHPLVEVIREEITDLPEDEITIIATGPLTSDKLAEKIHEFNGADGFYFMMQQHRLLTPTRLILIKSIKNLDMIKVRLTISTVQ